MDKIYGALTSPLEKINTIRDRILFWFIKPYWPSAILPNYLTYARMAVALLLFFLIFIFHIDSKILILSFFIFGALTDALDGSVARALNKVTPLGATLDPLADRLLIIPIMVYGLYKEYMWLLITIVTVELANLGIYVWLKTKEAPFTPHIFAKTKIVLLCLGLIGILVAWPHTPPAFAIYILEIAVVFSFLAIFAKIYESYRAHL